MSQDHSIGKRLAETIEDEYLQGCNQDVINACLYELNQMVEDGSAFPETPTPLRVYVLGYVLPESDGNPVFDVESVHLTQMDAIRQGFVKRNETRKLFDSGSQWFPLDGVECFETTADAITHAEKTNPYHCFYAVVSFAVQG